MDNTVLLVTLWIASGAFIGGVVTPVLAERKRANDWLMTLVGTAAGAVGNVVALLPLWGFLWTRKDENISGPVWMRDAATVETLERELAAESGPSAGEAFAMLRANFWPAERADAHSHRKEYVGVFVALAVITAIEVMLSFSEAGWIVGPLIMLSTIKVLLVAGFFMHLIYDSKWYSALFLLAIPFAGLILIVLALA